MDTVLDWTHRWFGCWREDADANRDWPSVVSWPTMDLGEEAMQFILRRLANGKRVCVSQAPGRNCNLCQHPFPPSMVWLSDGVWLWPDELVHYVEQHAVALPKKLLDRLLQSPAEQEVVVDPSKLEWPSSSAN